MVEHITDCNYQILYNKTITEINNDNIPENKYLLIGDEEINLVEKYKNVHNGYIFNSTEYHTQIVSSWRLIKIKKSLANDIFYETLDLDKVKHLPYTMDQLLENTKEFHFNTMIEFPAIFIMVKRSDREIKNKLIERLVSVLGKENKKEFLENSLVISYTERMAPYYSEKYPEMTIAHNINDDLIGVHLNKQKGCIIFDDCLKSKHYFNFNYDSNLFNAILSGRHYKTPIIILGQTCDGLSPDLRLSMNYAFLSNDTNPKNYKVMWDKYCSMFPTYKIFKIYYKKIMAKNDFLVVANKIPRTNINDVIYKMKFEYE